MPAPRRFRLFGVCIKCPHIEIIRIHQLIPAHHYSMSSAVLSSGKGLPQRQITTARRAELGHPLVSINTSQSPRQCSCVEVRRCQREGVSVLVRHRACDFLLCASLQGSICGFWCFGDPLLSAHSCMSDGDCAPISSPLGPAVMRFAARAAESSW